MPGLGFCTPHGAGAERRSESLAARVGARAADGQGLAGADPGDRADEAALVFGVIADVDRVPVGELSLGGGVAVDDGDSLAGLGVGARYLLVGGLWVAAALGARGEAVLLVLEADRVEVCVEGGWRGGGGGLGAEVGAGDLGPAGLLARLGAGGLVGVGGRGLACVGAAEGAGFGLAGWGFAAGGLGEGGGCG